MTTRNVLRTALNSVQKYWLGIAVSLTVCEIPATTLGYQLNTGLGYGLEYSSNIDKAPSSEATEDYINNVFADIFFTEISSSIDALVSGRLNYRSYWKGTSDDRLEPDLIAGVTWTLSPKRFSWRIDDFVLQTRIEQLETDTPDNRQTENAFLTGPNLFLRLSPRTNLELEARYGNFYYSETPSDNNDRLFGLARLVHQATPITDLSLNASFFSVDFSDDAVNVDYDRVDAFLGVRRETAISDLSVDLGGTAIERRGADNLRGGLLRLKASRRVTGGSNIGVDLALQLSDEGLDTISRGSQRLDTAGLETVEPRGETVPGEPQPVPLPPPTTDFPATSSTVGFTSTDIFFDKRLEIFYTRAWGSTLGRLSLFARDLDFKGTGLPTQSEDETDYGGRIELAREFTPSTIGALSGRYVRRDFPESSLIDNELNFAALLTRSFTRHFAGTLELSRLSRDSTDDARDFSEIRAFISLVYRTSPIPARPARPARQALP